MKKTKFLLAAIAMVVIVWITTFTLADAGNINRYSGGSSSSSSNYGSSSSYSSGSSSGSSGNYYVGSGFGGIFVLIIIGVIVLPILSTVIKNRNKNGNSNTVNTYYNDDIMSKLSSLSSDMIAKEIVAQDPYFSEEKFLAWVRDVYVKLQAAWTARDWRGVRPFESNELFEQHQTQLQEYINNNKINVVERVAVQSAQMIEYSLQQEQEVVVVLLQAVMKDYVIDATTKEVLEGNKLQDWTMRYRMTFARKAGVKTQPGTSNKSTTNCPNCGAPTEITSSGQCEYCDSVITTGEHDWVLTSLEGIE